MYVIELMLMGSNVAALAKKAKGGAVRVGPADANAFEGVPNPNWESLRGIPTLSSVSTVIILTT